MVGGACLKSAIGNRRLGTLILEGPRNRTWYRIGVFAGRSGTSQKERITVWSPKAKMTGPSQHFICQTGTVPGSIWSKVDSEQASRRTNEPSSRGGRGTDVVC